MVSGRPVTRRTTSAQQAHVNTLNALPDAETNDLQQGRSTSNSAKTKKSSGSKRPREAVASTSDAMPPRKHKPTEKGKDLLPNSPHLRSFQNVTFDTDSEESDL